MPKMPDHDLKALVAAHINGAVDAQGGRLAQERAQAERFYRGERLGNELEGRSQVVSRDVAEAVDAMLPSLMRIFAGGDEVVRFEPVGPEDEEAARQATDYVNWIWNRQNDGFSVFYDWFKDALLKMMGALKRFWGRINGAYATTGAANAYLLTPAVGLGAYVAGERYSFRASFANTGPATLDISGLGAKPIKKYGSTGIAVLAAGDIQNGQSVTVEYDGTDMILVTPVARSQDLAGVVLNTRSVASGAGLTGGGDLSADRTLAVGAGAGIVVHADDVAVDKAAQADMEAQSLDKVATADNMKWHPGVAKAWAKIQGSTGGVFAGYGVNPASTIRNGVGDYTVTWSVPFSTDSYAVVLTAEANSSGNNVGILQIKNGGQSIGSVVIKTLNGSGQPFDPASVSIVALGDQA